MVSCFIVNTKRGRGREGEVGKGRGEGGKEEEERGRQEGRGERKDGGGIYITTQPSYSGAFTDNLFCQVSWQLAKTVETPQHKHRLLNKSVIPLFYCLLSTMNLKHLLGFITRHLSTYHVSISTMWSKVTTIC